MVIGGINPLLPNLNLWVRILIICHRITVGYLECITEVQSSWNVMTHGDAREENWRGNKRMEWVTSKRHMTAEHRLARAVQTLQADVHSSPASSWLYWRPRRFKRTRPFRRKTKSGFCACAITFQTQSTTNPLLQHSSSTMLLQNQLGKSKFFSTLQTLLRWWIHSDKNGIHAGHYDAVLNP